MNRVPETPGSSEPDAIAPRTIHVLVADKDARVPAALRAAISSEPEPEPEPELLGAAPDAAAALLSDAEVTRVVALVDVSDAEETDPELVDLLSRRHLWWVVAMSGRSGLRSVSEAAARPPRGQGRGRGGGARVPSAPQRSARIVSSSTDGTDRRAAETWR